MPIARRELYRHFRGGIYEHLHVAKHHETGTLFVVYRSMATGEVFIRREVEFHDDVFYSGQMTYRFKVMTPSDVMRAWFAGELSNRQFLSKNTPEMPSTPG